MDIDHSKSRAMVGLVLDGIKGSEVLIQNLVY